MTTPGASIDTPAALRVQYEGWRWTKAWEHAHGVVYRLESGDGQARFLKLTVGPRGMRTLPEAERMRWARRYISVPDVIGVGSEDGVDWLLTVELPGTLWCGARAAR